MPVGPPHHRQLLLVLLIDLLALAVAEVDWILAFLVVGYVRAQRQTQGQDPAKQIDEKGKKRVGQ